MDQFKTTIVDVKKIGKLFGPWEATVETHYRSKHSKLRSMLGIKVNKKVETNKYLSDYGVFWLDVDSGNYADHDVQKRLHARARRIKAGV